MAVLYDKIVQVFFMWYNWNQSNMIPDTEQFNVYIIFEIQNIIKVKINIGSKIKFSSNHSWLYFTIILMYKTLSVLIFTLFFLSHTINSANT